MTSQETYDFSNVTEKLQMGVDSATPLEVRGRVIQVLGTIIKAHAPGTHIGELCALKNPWEEKQIMAEVVGFAKQMALLTPIGPIEGISSTTEVIPTGKSHRVAVGSAMLGRVLDGLGNPSDGKR